MFVSGVDDSGGDDLTEESLVEFLDSDHKMRYGVIKRISRSSGNFMAEVEMEDEFGDEFNEMGYPASPFRNYLSIPLAKCRQDSRFLDKSRRRNTSVSSNGRISFYFLTVELPFS